jgi:hypothetical protein
VQWTGERALSPPVAVVTFPGRRPAHRLASLVIERPPSACEDVVAGRTVLDPAMVSKLTSDDGVRLSGALKNLSPRELQMLGLMAKAHFASLTGRLLPRPTSDSQPGSLPESPSLWRPSGRVSSRHHEYRTSVSSVLRRTALIGQLLRHRLDRFCRVCGEWICQVG